MACFLKLFLALWTIFGDIDHLTVYCQCPNGFHLVAKDSACFHISKHSYKVCQAQAYCHIIGGRILDEFIVLKSNTNDLWFAISDLMKERDRQKTGWQWFNGNPVDPADLRERLEIVRKREDCTTYNPSTGKLSSTRCQEMRYATCLATPSAGKESVNKSGPRQVSFYLDANWSLNTDTGVMKDCFRADIRLNRLRCAELCYHEQECIAFFFEPKEELCKLNLYINAPLDSTTVGQWVRYVKKFL